MKRLWPLALIALVGCPHRPVEVRFGPEGEITDPQKLIDILKSREGAFTSLIGDARLHVESAQGNGTVKQFVAVQRPSSIHIESFDFFGRPLSSLVSDGAHFSLYDAEKNEFYRGAATDEVMARSLPVAIPAERVVSLMLGDVLIRRDHWSLKVDAAHGRYVLFAQNYVDVYQELELGTEDLRVIKESFRDTQGGGADDVQCDDYQLASNGRLFPYQFEYSEPQSPNQNEKFPSRIDLKYKYTDIKLNTELDPKLFHQDPPQSAKIIDLDATGNPIPSATP